MAECININLTPSQVENLVEFFEFNFIDSIRKDVDIDNMDYIVNMCDIYTTLKRHLQEEKGKNYVI